MTILKIILFFLICSSVGLINGTLFGWWGVPISIVMGYFIGTVFAHLKG